MAQRSTSALRYAEAVFQVAQEHHNFDLWLRELGEVVGLVNAPEAARVLQSPAIPVERKAAILNEALAGLDPSVHRLVDLLLRRHRLALMPQVLEHLARLVDEASGLATVDVTTAVPLSPAESELLARRLSAQTGKRVRLQEKVDPAIIGGVVAQIGDEVIDGSVRGRLDRLRRALVAG